MTDGGSQFLSLHAVASQRARVVGRVSGATMAPHFQRRAHVQRRDSKLFGIMGDALSVAAPRSRLLRRPR